MLPTIPVRAFVAGRAKACERPHKQMSAAAQITNATVPDTDVSFQNGGSCYLLVRPIFAGLIGERDIDGNTPPHIDR
jgi:hypothetical protein